MSSDPLALPDNWSVLSLRDAGVRLIDCVHKTPAAQESGYPYIGIPQMKGDRLDFDSARKISHEDFLDWTKKAKPQPRDVILSRRTNPGVTAIDRTGTEFALGQNLVLLRADGSRVNPAFLKWLVRSPAWWREIGKYINVGAVFDSLRCADVPNFELPIPPLAVQLRNGALLDALDNKIELNRRMNETLEAMARAIFKDWFVDFGPVRAKMEGREPYLPGGLWDLFPDALGDDGKPVGWTTYTLGPLAFHHRATLSPIAEPGRIYEHYSIPAYDAGNQPLLNTGDSIKSNKTIVPDGAVLLSKLNPDIERVWLPNPVGEAPQVASTEFLALTPLAPATRAVLFCLFKTKRFRTEMTAMVTGTSKSHQRVSPKALFASDVLVADPSPMDAFDQAVRPSIDRLLSNRLETARLARTRDLLLPKLVSGEIRVIDAEQVVEAIA